MRLHVLGLLLLLFTGCGSMRSGVSEDAEVSGFPFVYRKVVDGDSTETEVLYPVYRKIEQPGRLVTWLIPVYWYRALSNEQGRLDEDWGAFPLIFGGTDPEEGEYRMIFPITGNLKGFFDKDEIRIWMFPIYVDTRDGEHFGQSFLWPLISWGEGDGRSSFRILPFYSEKDGLTGWSRAVLWPFFTWGETDVHTDYPRSDFFFFPFYGTANTEVSWSHTVLFPFFSWAGTETGYREVNFAWPFFRRKTRPDGDYEMHIWPLHGVSRSGVHNETYFFWPIVWYEEERMPRGFVKTSRIIPIIRRSDYLDDKGDVRGSEFLLWPLMRWEEDAEGRMHYRTLSIIPFRSWHSFDAAFSWAWTIYRYREYPGDVTDARLLSGLFGYRSDPEGDSLQLLWFIRIPL